MAMPKSVEYVVKDFLNWKAYMHPTAAVTSWLSHNSVSLRLLGSTIAFMTKDYPDQLFIWYSDSPAWEAVMHILKIQEDTIQLCKKTRVMCSVLLHSGAAITADPEILL